MRSQYVPVALANAAELVAQGFTHVELWKSEDESATWTELRASREALDSTVFIYNLHDPLASKHDRYKWRLIGDGHETDFSTWVHAGRSIPVEKVSVGYARFFEICGKPAEGRIIVCDDSPAVRGGIQVNPAPIIFEADSEGWVHAPMLRGAQVRIVVEGSAITRNITVPTTPTFDILGAIADASDMFAVQALPPLLTRRSI